MTQPRNLYLKSIDVLCPSCYQFDRYHPSFKHVMAKTISNPPEFDNSSQTSVESFGDQTWVDLVQHITTDLLSELQLIFKNHSDGLNKSEFTSAFTELFKHPNCLKPSIDLFEQIAAKDTIRITWNNFLDFLVANLTSKTVNELDLRLKSIISVPQTKRECIVKIVLLESQKYFCYAVITKHGRVGLYDGNLNFLTTYQVIMTREDINRKEEHRRRRNRWITDAVFFKDVQMFVVTNTARSIMFYEASGLKHVPMWLVLSTPNIVQCFAYKHTKSASVLFMGDDKGFVFSFRFLQPKTSLLRRKHNDKISLFYWDELAEEKEYVVVKRPVRLHQQNVRHLAYFGDNESLVSCSRDPDSSLVIKYKGHKNRPHNFKMSKGCNCFVLSRKHKILITGSDDGVLRLWNPIITSKPVGVIKGHDAALVDVRMFEERSVILSCSSEGCLKLWQLQDEKCIQSLTINFPSFTVFGKLIEWGIECLYPGPKRMSDSDDLNIWERSPILVTCCNHIALITVQNETQDSQVLSPPPLQNSVLVPNSWKTSEDDPEYFGSATVELQLDPSVLEKRLAELEFIIKKDLFADNTANNSDINFKIATLESKKLHMQEHVARGAPYLALDLHEVHQLTLSPDLPSSKKKKIKNVVDQIERMLEDANCRDLIFSEVSSSRSPRSSRSSFVEFDY